MSAPTNGNAPELAGERGAKETASNAADCADNVADNQAVKPEVDLARWASLGGNIKPSRIDRKQKRGWKRRAGP